VPDDPALDRDGHMKFSVTDLAIPDVKLIASPPFKDARGFFAEIYRRDDFVAGGIDCEFVQDNHSGSSAAGTVRGLHFQIAPYAQAKLLRVLTGRIFDVCVDLRRSSPTYGRHVAVELDADSGMQLCVPVGFAHGYCTLAPNTEVFYKVSNIYSPAHERGLFWADPALDIPWPVSVQAAVVSERDKSAPLFASLAERFA
jgi:dTDP-4-dehydrorhamnose 3,5-epimerase